MVTGRRAAVAVVVILAMAVGGFIAAAGHPWSRAAAPAERQPAQIIAPGQFPAAPPVLTSPTPLAESHVGLRIQLPGLGINLPIVEGDGYNAPLYEAAHYPGSAWPGDNARSVIYAHARAGMFGPLFQAKVGDQVVIDRPDGPPLNYTIKQYYPKWPITDTSVLQPLNQAQIVLITCTTYNYDDPRIVAVAVPQ